MGVYSPSGEGGVAKKGVAVGSDMAPSSTSEQEVCQSFPNNKGLDCSTTWLKKIAYKMDNIYLVIFFIWIA